MSSNDNGLGNGKNSKNGKKRRRIIWGAIAVVVLGAPDMASRRRSALAARLTLQRLLPRSAATWRAS